MWTDGEAYVSETAFLVVLIERSCLLSYWRFEIGRVTVQNVNLLDSHCGETVEDTLVDCFCGQSAIRRHARQDFRVDLKRSWELRSAEYLLGLSVHVAGSGVEPLDACFIQRGAKIVGIQFVDVAADESGSHFDGRVVGVKSIVKMERIKYSSIVASYLSSSALVEPYSP